MNLSEHTITELVSFVNGENNMPTAYMKGEDIVNIFNKYGCNDIYDSMNGGFPFLNKDGYRRPSRKEYTKNRLRGLVGSENLRYLLEDILRSCLNLCKKSFYDDAYEGKLHHSLR